MEMLACSTRGIAPFAAVSALIARVSFAATITRLAGITLLPGGSLWSRRSRDGSCGWGGGAPSDKKSQQNRASK